MKAASTSIMLALGLALLYPNVCHAQGGTVYVQPPPQYGQQQYYVPQAQPPQQPRTRERVHIGMIVGGAAMLGASWILHGLLISPFAGWSLNRGYQREWEAFRFLGIVPVVGPWIQLGIKPSGLSDDGWGPYLVVNGIIQAAGLALLIVGATVRETVTVYGDREGGGSFLAVGPTGNGLQLVGAF